MSSGVASQNLSKKMKVKKVRVGSYFRHFQKMMTSSYGNNVINCRNFYQRCQFIFGAYWKICHFDWINISKIMKKFRLQSGLIIRWNTCIFIFSQVQVSHFVMCFPISPISPKDRSANFEKY